MAGHCRGSRPRRPPTARPTAPRPGPGSPRRSRRGARCRRAARTGRRQRTPGGVRPGSTRPRATKALPIAGARQLTEKCEASTRPARVNAAKPQAVSISAPIIPAWRKPAYCPCSSCHGIESSISPAARQRTSNPARRLKAALALRATSAACRSAVSAMKLLLEREFPSIMAAAAMKRRLAGDSGVGETPRSRGCDDDIRPKAARRSAEVPGRGRAERDRRPRRVRRRGDSGARARSARSAASRSASPRRGSGRAARRGS